MFGEAQSFDKVIPITNRRVVRTSAVGISKGEGRAATIRNVKFLYRSRLTGLAGNEISVACNGHVSRRRKSKPEARRMRRAPLGTGLDAIANSDSVHW